MDFEQALRRHVLPESWDELAPADFQPLTTGMSDASVFLVTAAGRPPRYLKLARDKAAVALREEIARTTWLADGRVRVPTILKIDNSPGQTVVLMEAVAGAPANEAPLVAPDLVAALARALAALHALPVAECRFDETVAVRLSRAAAAVAAGEVDADAFDTRNHGTKPADLLARLVADRPVENMVVVHGDATLSNMIVDSDGTVGFVDCGNAGRGDRYTDLAVLRADIEEHYGAEAAERFIRSYGLEAWDEPKARFFSDLYEFF